MTAGTATRHAKLLIDGRWIAGVDRTPVYDKFSGVEIGCVERASREQVDSAVAAARRSFERLQIDPYERYRILTRVAALLEGRRDDLARTIVSEAGFPMADARNEVNRAVQTFTVSGEEAKRLVGEMVPIQAAPGAAHRMAFTIRVPRGVVCGITSFNSPLNMVAHKVAPALAAGNSVVVKPPQATPFSAAALFDILLEAGLPSGHAALIQGPGADIGQWLVDNPQIAYYTFTGSTSVGKWLQHAVGMRPVALELGSISATIVCEDADLERAATRCVASGFARAGQVCTSTQRLFVHGDVFDRFTAMLVEATNKLVVGDPHDPKTTVGPMISEDEAMRAESWVRDAVAAGARVLVGGQRRGNLFMPTILAGTTAGMRVLCEEIFAPVLSVIPFTDFDAVVDQVNAVPYGLAVGLFTRDIMRALNASKRLHVGIVHVNESSSSRVDLMPFTGVKDSGLGREGPKYAMQEMTEERLITISLS